MKANIHLPLTQVTIADFGYPVDALLKSCFQRLMLLSNLLDYELTS